jgi:membrane protease YdiL (CAAX protease family)
MVILTGAWLSGASFASAFGHDMAVIEKLGSLPLALVMLLALRAGVMEEILFRGYGIERLAAVIGHRWSAAMVSLAIFTLAHLGGWDLIYLLIVFPAGLVLTLLYLWRRDLWANILAHFLTDASSFVFAYAIAHHLVRARM